MLIGWTTVGTQGEADRFAGETIGHRLAACVQVEGPVTSTYRWEGKVAKSHEFRLCIKFLPEQAVALSAWVPARHPDQTPEWIVVSAVEVGEKYLSWAKANSTNPPL
jgi:periplasmic divalent cation tolerance protein